MHPVAIFLADWYLGDEKKGGRSAPASEMNSITPGAPEIAPRDPVISPGDSEIAPEELVIAPDAPEVSAKHSEISPAAPEKSAKCPRNIA